MSYFKITYIFTVKRVRKCKRVRIITSVICIRSVIDRDVHVLGFGFGLFPVAQELVQFV